MSKTLRPRDVADRYGCNVSKVLTWIHAGELKAIDVSSTRGGKPRWRIDPADLALFEAKRSSTPAPKPTRRRRKKDPAIIEFF